MKAGESFKCRRGWMHVWVEYSDGTVREAMCRECIDEMAATLERLSRCDSREQPAAFYGAAGDLIRQLLSSPQVFVSSSSAVPLSALESGVVSAVVPIPTTEAISTELEEAFAAGDR